MDMSENNISQNDGEISDDKNEENIENQVNATDTTAPLVEVDLSEGPPLVVSEVEKKAEVLDNKEDIDLSEGPPLAVNEVEKKAEVLDNKEDIDLSEAPPLAVNEGEKKAEVLDNKEDAEQVVSTSPDENQSSPTVENKVNQAVTNSEAIDANDIEDEKNVQMEMEETPLRESNDIEKEKTIAHHINGKENEETEFAEDDKLIVHQKTKKPDRELTGYPDRKWSPRKDAWFFSKHFSYFWTTSLFVKGSKSSLEENDLEGVMPDVCLHPLTEKLERKWHQLAYNEESEIDKKASLQSAIIKAFGWSYLLLGLLPATIEVCKMIQPIFIGLLIQYFVVGSTISQGTAVAYAFMIVLLFFVISWLTVAYNDHRLIAGAKVRLALSGLIYKKILSATPQALGRTSTGLIMNLFASDCQKVERAAVLLHYAVIGPIEFVIMAVLLYKELGPSSIAGLAMLLLLSPTQLLMGRGLMWCRRKIMKWTDERVRIMNEIISGIKVIKLYTWENAFTDHVFKVRKKEIKAIQQMAWLRVSFLSFFFSSGSLVAFFTFMTYVLVGNQLTSKKVFTSLALLNVARMMFTRFFPIGVAFYLEALVGLERIQKFLIEDEIDMNNSGKIFRPKPENCSVKVDNITASWTEEDTPTLKDISLEVKPDELLAVVGPVGSGKSSLLMAVLGELAPSKGDINVKGRVAYVSQEAWIFNGTVRYNITFGNDFDEEKYNEVLKVCGLERDLELLAQGDKTLVGERGVTLSGGQKTRINLARAVYSNADIYLLDDPLSAVDAHVGRHLYDQCINGYLSSKPKILVTHQIQYLTNADNIIALKDGKCVGQGSLKELNMDPNASGSDNGTCIESGIDDFAALCQPPKDGCNKPPSFNRFLSILSSWNSNLNLSSNIDISALNVTSNENIENERIIEEENGLIPRETKQAGSILFDVYARFFRAGYGLCTWLMLLLLLVISQVIQVIGDWWLAYWCNQEEQFTNEPYPNRDRELAIYGVLTFTLVTLGLVRALFFFKVILKSTERIHMKMFKALMRTPLYFFDTNSIGRILNRFSTDTGLVDDMLSYTCFELCTITLMVISMFTLIAVNMAIILALLIPIIIIGIWTRIYFIKTAREVRRIESIARSPVYGHISTTLLGISTIRSYRVQEKFFDLFAETQDHHSEAFFSYITCASWLYFNLDLLCGMFVTFCVMIPLIFAEQFTAGTVGLLIVYAISVPPSIQRVLLQSTEMENQFTSVERILEYCDLTSEADDETEVQLESDWPRCGTIIFDKVDFRYHESLPNVLHSFTAHIESKQKIGICGRTGAGKSSLLSTLFRTSEPDGLITIDEVDIQKIGLKDLRSKISIIPQEPIIFSGTMRRNIDPFDEYHDEELWDVLEQVRLKETVNDLPHKLETMMSESGSNLSVGQRQLVCLARAILRNNRILVIDEATANVDLNTDNLIQETIRDKFKDCTVLTIAHRLKTIMDSDKIMALDAGELKEFDKPYKLLRCKNSIFYSLVKQTGEEVQFFEIAYRSYCKEKMKKNENESEIKRGELGDCNSNCRCKRKSGRKSSSKKKRNSKSEKEDTPTRRGSKSEKRSSKRKSSTPDTNIEMVPEVVITSNED